MRTTKLKPCYTCGVLILPGVCNYYCDLPALLQYTLLPDIAMSIDIRRHIGKIYNIAIMIAGLQDGRQIAIAIMIAESQVLCRGNLNCRASAQGHIFLSYPAPPTCAVAPPAPYSQ